MPSPSGCRMAWTKQDGGRGGVLNERRLQSFLKIVRWYTILALFYLMRVVMRV
jgi:hypothetical protein